LALGRTDEATSEARFEEAQFNYRAGVPAMDALGLKESDYYFSQSAVLCTIDRWATHYDFMFELYKKFARSALMKGDQERSNDIVTIAIKHAETGLDRAECL